MFDRVQTPVFVVDVVVLYGDVRHRGGAEAAGQQPQILLQGRLEHLRFYHRDPVAAGAQPGKRLGNLRPPLLSIGNALCRVSLAGANCSHLPTLLHFCANNWHRWTRPHSVSKSH